MEWTDQELVIEAGREMGSRNGVFLTLQLDTRRALALLGMLQLALRHPQATNQAAKSMEALAKTIEAGLGRLGPATAELCARGWKPEHDVDAQGEPAKSRRTESSTLH